REQRQQVGDRGDVAGAGVSGRVDEAGQVQGEQVRQGEQQPGQPGRVAAGALAGDVGVVLVLQGPGPGQVFASGPAAGGVRAAPDPRQPGLDDHFVDPGAVQSDAFAGQYRADLVDRVALRAQLDDPGAG